MIKIRLMFSFTCLLWLSVSHLHAQLLTIEEAYKLAREHYPLAKQRDLIARTRDFSIDNAAKSYLPQVSIVGQASYQSAVTEFNLPAEIPGLVKVFTQKRIPANFPGQGDCRAHFLYADNAVADYAAGSRLRDQEYQPGRC